jgi:hypothetical protein
MEQQVSDKFYNPFLGSFFLNIKNPILMKDIGVHTLLEYLVEFEKMNICNRSDSVRILQKAFLLIAEKFDYQIQDQIQKVDIEFFNALLNVNHSIYIKYELDNHFLRIFRKTVSGLQDKKFAYRLLQLLPPLLKSKGIDGFCYHNTFEGSKSLCYIPLYPKQIAHVNDFLQ